MLLLALKDIPGPIQITAGQRFYELNPEHAQNWLQTGFARPVESTTNRRGWDGLQWDGAEVVILASGPSMSLEQAAAAQRWRDAAPDRYAIAINTTYRRAPWADVIYACDGTWWDGKDKEGPSYVEDVRARCPQASLWTQEDAAAKRLNLRLIRPDSGKGLGRRPGLINLGFNSGYQAIGLAYQAGAAVVYLLGFDMRGGHWHKDHPGSLNKVNRFDVFLKAFDLLAADVAKTPGFEVINLTPKSAMRCFPMRDWQEVFA